MMRLLLYPVRRDQEFHFLHKKGCVWTVHWKMIYIKVIKYGDFFILLVLCILEVKTQNIND